jgi:predicted alpha/beta-hydrolase family hydrolase
MDLLFDGPEAARDRIVLAHGAGAPMDDPFLTAIAAGLGARGLRVARFEFPYMAARRSGRRKPEQLRTAHLETLRTPALIVQGTRDPFGTPAEVAGYRLAPSIHVHWIEDGDHSLAPRKRSAQRAEGERSPIGPASGRTRGEARDEAIACVAEFVAAL